MPAGVTRVDMEQQVRERFARWIEETKELFGVLPEILNHDQLLTAKTDQAEQETERLRRELNDLRKELADSKAQGVDLRREHGDLLKELDETRRQNEQLRTDKDEAAQALAKVLETVQATNQIAQKLGVTRSPFARRDAAAPAAASQPAPHE
jgi:septal ring factor EnvC (AmiA/AmiB activator)